MSHQTKPSPSIFQYPFESEEEKRSHSTCKIFTKTPKPKKLTLKRSKSAGK